MEKSVGNADTSDSEATGVNSELLRLQLEPLYTNS